MLTFDTRKKETEESYCGFNQLSWHNADYFSQLSTRDLMRLLTWSTCRRRQRLNPFSLTSFTPALQFNTDRFAKAR